MVTFHHSRRQLKMCLRVGCKGCCRLCDNSCEAKDSNCSLHPPPHNTMYPHATVAIVTCYVCNGCFLHLIFRKMAENDEESAAAQELVLSSTVQYSSSVVIMTYS
jgi:hypothetical protein